MNLATLQQEVGIWHGQHFSDASDTHIVLKLLEEAGELAKAHNDRLLAKGSSRQMRASHKEEDAVGDIAIVLTALCAKWGLSLERIIEATWRDVQGRDDARIRKA